MKWVLFLPLAPGFLGAQVPASTVTVAVSQASSPASQSVYQPQFQVTVTAGLNYGIDDVVALLPGLGITAASLTNVEGPYNFGGGAPSSLNWTFPLLAPHGKAADTVAALIALQKSISQNGSGASLSFSSNVEQVAAPQSQTCDFAGLIALARSQAQGMAAAAGLTLGSVVSVSSNVEQSAPVCGLTVSFGVVALFTQPPPAALTVSALRTIPAVSSNSLQTQLQLIMTSGQAATLDDITAALTAGGINGASFYGVSSTTLYGNTGAASPGLQWSFVLNLPVAMLKGILAQVVALEQSLAAGTTGLTLSAGVEGISQAAASAPSQPAPACDNTGLVADARAQAQTVAAAAGLTAGNILTVSSGSLLQSQPVPTQAVIFDPAFPFPGFPVASQTQCGLTVQFQLF